MVAFSSSALTLPLGCSHGFPSRNWTQELGEPRRANKHLVCDSGARLARLNSRFQSFGRHFRCRCVHYFVHRGRSNFLFHTVSPGMTTTANKITGPNAGGRRQLPISTPVAASVGQF